MTAPLTAGQVELLRAAAVEALTWRAGVGYFLDGVEVDAATRHMVNDLIADGLLWLPALPEPGGVATVGISDRGLMALR